jgi:hypothetical protein
MKVGDLVKWNDKLHIVTKEWTNLYNLQEVNSDYPPSIIDKGLIKIYTELGDLTIISKSLNKS